MDSKKNQGLTSSILVSPTPASQLELGIARAKEADRNAHLGGRSFYFFDFDDNVAFLATPLILFHKQTNAELPISSGQYAQEHNNIGKSGPFKDYDISWDDLAGTFRNFRDRHIDELRRLGMESQAFLQDVAQALGLPDFNWKGPSWSCFYHATFNQRPVSVITARGHQPSTIVGGIELFVQSGHLPQKPNFLSIYPVSNKQTRIELGDSDFKQSTAELKQAAIRASVEKAIQMYGENPHHRFGMSDDDPKNIQLIAEEMIRLKSKYDRMSFFLIETFNGDFVKHEITTNGMKDFRLSDREARQYSLFTDLSPVK
jgi:hypothetical protein